MTIFFNMKVLEKEGKGNPIYCINLLKGYANKSKLLKHNLRNRLRGMSFLLEPSTLFNSNVDILYIYQYLLLAAKRDYALYKLYGIKYLPLSHYPDINLDSIKTNPLLKITNTEIHFKLEE